LKKSINNLIKENIYILIPFVMYGIYKNGYLIYQKNIINIFGIFKPLYLVVISVLIKILVDLIKYKKIKFDYNFIYVILIAMIMPYNINYLVYIILFSILYFLSTFINLKVNKVCIIYLIILLVNSLFNVFTYLNPLEINYSYNFEFLDYLFGRNIGGISTTSIILSLISYIYLINNYYYKKDIPFIINLSYLFLSFIYFIFTNNNTFLLNSELIFASIFIATLPEFSPHKRNFQIIYSLLIGILTFVISILFNSIISVYIAIFIISLLNMLDFHHKSTK